jgi:hypothetical protein
MASSVKHLYNFPHMRALLLMWTVEQIHSDLHYTELRCMSYLKQKELLHRRQLVIQPQTRPPEPMLAEPGITAVGGAGPRDVFLQQLYQI